MQVTITTTTTTTTTTRGGAIPQWLACSTNDREVGVRVPLAAGGRVAIVCQLRFASWAWVYSTLHPFGVGKWVRLGRFKAGMCDAAWCAPCTWVPLRWAVLTKGAIASVRPLHFTFNNKNNSNSDINNTDELLQYHQITIWYHKHSRSTCSSANHLFLVPRHNLSFGFRDFRISVSKIEFLIPPHILQSQNILFI